MRYAATLAVVLGISGVAAAEPSTPNVKWNDQRPEFVHDVYFSDEPWGEPVQPPPGPLAEKWGFYVPNGMPLWLQVEVEGDAPGEALCVTWVDPAGDVAHESCQRIPGGQARLAFRAPDNHGWPTGAYAARLHLRSLVDLVALGEVAYAIGELPEMAAPDNGGGEEIPSFPWPPPRPTTQMVLPREQVLADRATLGDVADHLVAALSTCGYAEHSFYAAPGGFALTTRLEQIEFDGTPLPEPQRWSTSPEPRSTFSIRDYLRALFSAPEGHYRVVVFIVNDEPFSSSGAEVSDEDALAWLSGGLNVLPGRIARQPLGDDHNATALIYQFRQTGHSGEPESNPDGAATAQRHLQRSGVLAALEQ